MSRTRLERVRAAAGIASLALQQIDRLQRRYHGAQQDVADTLDIQRNQVRRQTQRYRPDQTADSADS